MWVKFGLLLLFELRGFEAAPAPNTPAPPIVLNTWVFGWEGASCQEVCTNANVGGTCDVSVHQPVINSVLFNNVRQGTSGGIRDLSGLFTVSVLAESIPYGIGSSGTGTMWSDTCPLYDRVEPSSERNRYCDPASSPKCNSKRAGLYRFCYCTGVNAAMVAGDPVTWFGNLRVEFHLPENKPILIFRDPSVDVFGTASAGWRNDQWFTRIVIKTPSGKTIVDIGMKQDLQDFNRSLLPKDAFETLNVLMSDSWATPLPVFPRADQYFFKHGITGTFVRPALNIQTATSVIPRRECVSIRATHSKMLICSTSAHEYFGEGIGAYKFAHLDVEFFDIHSKNGGIEGALPELWGMIPMTETTRSYILSESGTRPSSQESLPDRAFVDTKPVDAKREDEDVVRV